MRCGPGRKAVKVRGPPGLRTVCGTTMPTVLEIADLREHSNGPDLQSLKGNRIQTKCFYI